MCEVSIQSNYTAIVYNFYDKDALYLHLDQFKQHRDKMYISKGLKPSPLTLNEESFLI